MSIYHGAKRVSHPKAQMHDQLYVWSKIPLIPDNKYIKFKS